MARKRSRKSCGDFLAGKISKKKLRQAGQRYGMPGTMGPVPTVGMQTTPLITGLGCATIFCNTLWFWPCTAPPVGAGATCVYTCQAPCCCGDNDDNGRCCCQNNGPWSTVPTWIWGCVPTQLCPPPCCDCSDTDESDEEES